MSRNNLENLLAQVKELLHRQRLVENLVHSQNIPKHDLVESLVHKQNLVELENKIKRIHTADLAHILEILPPSERYQLWNNVHDSRGGDILLEVSDTVRPSLINALAQPALLTLLEGLDGDDISAIAEDVPKQVLRKRLATLTPSDQLWLQSSLDYDEETVGHHMRNDILVLQDPSHISDVYAYMRSLSEIPENTDKAFVVDKRGALKGAVKLQEILRAKPEDPIEQWLLSDLISFKPDEHTDGAAKAFERYDLISAPVVNERNKLIGRLTVDTILDYLREESTEEVLNMAGLKGEEDIYAPIWSSAKNRGFWLLVNLGAAFIAARLIGAFEQTIGQLVALAALMPIVASIGGNTGNQTTALIIRGLAQGQIGHHNIKYLIRKEFSISVVNGSTMGIIVGLFSYLLYHNLALSLVITIAMVLTLISAGMIGLFVPILLEKLGRDPALGSSVIQTATTDNIGFLIFLGLASSYLV